MAVDISQIKSRLTDIEILPSDTLLQSLLDGTKWVILNRRFPIGEIPTAAGGAIEVPPRYEDLQVRMVVELVRRLGNEGMIQRSENGVTTQWTTANVSNELKGEIVPMVGRF